jgi:peptidoglycan/xylan/chitin deacetylase (PgdA/CDA1 family)/GT2 family glycosyltransferase
VKLSVVIATYNRLHALKRTIPTVLAQAFPADDWEVVVVVDGSRDGTVRYLRSLQPACRLRIIEAPHRGQPAARNLGAKSAAGDLILLLDDDIVCTTNLVRAHVAAHEAQNSSSVVIGRILISEDSPRSLATEDARDSFEAYSILQRSAGWPRSPYEAWVSANSSLPRSLFLGVGGCDERLRRGHDDDLTIRLWNAGASFSHLPAATVWQYYVKTNKELVTSDGRIEGPTELSLCRRYPGYRASSRLGRLMRPSATIRPFAWLSCCAPVSPELLLRAPCWAAEKLMPIRFFRRAGLRLLGRRVAITVLRSAAANAGSWRTLKNELGRPLPVLRYNHVGQHAGSSGDDNQTVTPAQFGRQMEWLARHGYTGIRPSDWLRSRSEGKALPRRPVLITFDSDDADVVEHALPVLRRLDFGAVIYVTTRRLGASRNGSMARPMSVAQMKQLAREGLVEFGAHSRTHPDLTKLSAAQLREEVEGSAEDLEGILAQRPLSFAYPHGRHSAAVRDCVARNYGLALTSDPGLNGLATDPYLLRSVTIHPTDGRFSFACRVRFGVPARVSHGPAETPSVAPMPQPKALART